jgi:hypothetical protein
MELWKTIEGYPKYEVSSLGRIKSYQKSEPQILKGGYDKDGYHLILLYNENGRVTKKVHRLVAEAFIPNPKNSPQVNHKDGNKRNNSSGNLEWSTCEENITHAFNIGLRPKEVMSIRIPVAKLDLQTGEILKVYDSATAALKDGFHRQSIGRVCRGERPHHKGYGWKYA